MLRLCAGFALFVLVAVAQAAQPGENLAASKPAQLTIAPANADVDVLPAYQYRSVLLKASDTTSGKFEFDDDVPSPPSLSWRPTYDGISLPALPKVEIKVAQANVVFRLHSVSIDEERFKLTFNTDSALIEKEGIKIRLQPHQAAILWHTAF